jgi:hypothetical protein
MVPAAADNDRSRVRRGRWRWVAVLIVTAVAGTAVAVALVVNTRQQPRACPTVTSPLGELAARPQIPRLCDLGAPSKVIGAGRLDGVNWRIVVTPPRPWSVYEAAGFRLPLGSGKGGNCIIEVYSGSPEFGCGEWQTAGLAGKFVTGIWGAGAIGVGCTGLDARAAYFVVVPANGPEVRVHSTRYLGVSFAAFALPGSAGKPAVITAYDAHGRPVASTTTF